jgi:small subunit ribosomal protein S36
VRVATGLLVVLFVLGLVRARSAAARVDRLFLLWPTAALFALMTLQSAQHFHHSYYVSGISGRYLFGGLVALAAGVGAGAAAAGRLARWMPLLVLAGSAALQAKSVSMVFPHFWEPRGGGLRDAWDSMTAWSPWPSTAAAGTVGLIALLAVVTVAWLLVVAVRAGRPAGPPGLRRPESHRRTAGR